MPTVADVYKIWSLQLFNDMQNMAVMLYLGYENINFTYYDAVQYCFRPGKMYFAYLRVPCFDLAAF